MSQSSNEQFHYWKQDPHVGLKGKHERVENEDIILNALSGLRYGNVQITVQDGLIIQLERCERHRVHGETNQKHNAKSVSKHQA